MARYHRNATAGIAAALVVAVLSSASVADERQPPPSPDLVVAQASGQRAQPAEPDAFGKIARWLDRSVHDLSGGLKDAFGGVGQGDDRTRDVLRGTAKDMSGSPASPALLPDLRIVDERVVCPSAANGAPDCRRAAEVVCRLHGFRSGRSFEVRSEEKCSFRALLARRTGQPNTCRRETYVLRSMCQ